MLVETYRGVVYPWMIDQAGHLVTWRYSEMFDVAGYHFFHMLGARVDQNGAFVLADVGQELAMKAEVKSGALLLVRSAVARLGNSSLTTRHDMSIVGEGAVCSTMSTTTVFIDKITRRPMPIPAEIRERAASMSLQEND